MFVLLVATYWLFWSISAVTVAHFLYVTSFSHFTLIVGFYLLSKAVKTLTEYQLMRQKAQYMDFIKKQGNAVGNLKTDEPQQTGTQN